MVHDAFLHRTVVITGAGGGIGAALVAMFHARGARVIGCDRTLQALDDPKIDARQVFDLSRPAESAQAAHALLAREGVPDVLVNNAGWSRADTLADLDMDALRREIDLNLTGVMAFTNPLAQAMAARAGGSIVFVSSVNAMAHFGNPAYAAAKAGINAYARALAVELGAAGVRANTVCPGTTRTPAWDHRIGARPEVLRRLTRLYPLGRVVDAAEVAQAVAFLASDLASGITGVALPVDAGLTAGCLPFIHDVMGE